MKMYLVAATMIAPLAIVGAGYGLSQIEAGQRGNSANPAHWIKCADEGGTCKVPSTARVRFGAGRVFVYKLVKGSIACNSAAWGGDPAKNTVKTCAYGSETAAGDEEAPLPPTPASARDRLGINVALITYWSGEQTFVNQAMSIDWLDPTKAGWPGIDNARIRPDGMPISVAKGAPVVAILNPPAVAYTTTTGRTRCTWQGKGSVWMGGGYLNADFGDHWIDFTWPKGLPAQQRTWFEIRESAAADPIRALDCRLKTDAKDAVFAPQLLDYLRPYGVLRFLDWSSTNGSPDKVTWATRTLPGSLEFNGTDGVALEYIIALSNANKSSPWLTIPWNADADYHRRAALLMHDSIPASRQIYVENSNEVWNYSFRATYQAEKEGVAAKLSDTPFQSVLHRYAQKTSEVMKIWARVFADRPGQLVRVAATQNDNPWTGEVIMAFGDLKDNIDALATAPYFGHSFFSGPLEKETNLDVLMPTLAGYAKQVVAGPTAKNAALAARFGKRFITYEAGQHVIEAGGTDRIAAMEHDPRMEGIYVDYLNGMNATTGDLVTLYAATSGISRYGAWGLREYAGQPLSETPKLRGTLKFVEQTRR